jgi:hypothetical protein
VVEVRGDPSPGVFGAEDLDEQLDVEIEILPKRQLEAFVNRSRGQAVSDRRAGSHPGGQRQGGVADLGGWHDLVLAEAAEYDRDRERPLLAQRNKADLTYPTGMRHWSAVKAGTANTLAAELGRGLMAMVTTPV